MTRRPAELLAAMALMAVTLMACGESNGGNAAGGDGPADPAKVTLRVADQKFSAVRSLLAAAGQLEGVTYKISWSQFTSGPPILEAINAGATDFGVVGNTPPVFAAAAGSKITVVGATDQSLDGQAIVVPRGSALRSAADLKGRKVAVAKGSNAHAHLLAVLAKNGLRFTDVRPQYLQPADALAALSAGKVDAWATWEPFTAQAETQAGARILVDGNGYLNGYNFQVTSPAALEDEAKSAALKDFLSRYRRAVLWSNGHQRQWAAVWSKDTGIAAPALEKAAARRITRIIKIDGTVTSAEQRLADSFTEAGLVPGKVEIADRFDPRFNETVPAA